MPFAPRKQTDEELQQQTSSPNISGQSTSFNVNVPGGSGGMAGKPKAKSSGQYQNLQKYISANQEQAGQMASKVASDVESQVGGAKQAVGGIASQVQKTQAYDPNAAISRAGQLSGEEKQAYTAQKQTGGYTGAQDVYGLSGYQEAAKKATEAATTASLAGSEQGQKELLKKSFARPTYTGGASALDQALIQYNQPAKQQISSLADKYKDLSSQFQGQFNEAQTGIQQSLDQAKANKAAIAAAEAKAKADLLGGVSARASQMAAAAPKAQEAFKADIADDALTAETMAALGLSAGQNLYDINLGNYVNYNQTPINANAVATSEERKRYQDLMNLFGTTGTDLSAEGPGVDVSPVQVNREQLMADIESRKLEATKAAAQPVDTANFESVAYANPPQSLPEARFRQMVLTPAIQGMSVDMMRSALANNVPLGNMTQEGWDAFGRKALQDYVANFDKNYSYNRKVGQA